MALTPPDAMNLDDESFLSAYLDDELDPADRLAVEWSVESSPPLAEQLRALATARDAVAGLGRPGLPRDLAPAIVDRLAADRRRARLRALARPGRVAASVAGLSAMAASLLFALFLLHRSTHEHPAGGPPAVATRGPAAPTPRTHPIDPIEASTAKLVRADHALAGPRPAAPAPSPPAVAIPDEAGEQEARRRITAMLEQPEVRLILITTDVIDASGRIQDLIGQDPRKTADFGRITIRAGVVVDPARPDSAEVFVVPVVEGGRRTFLDRLRGEFGDLTEEEPGPDLVTQLTEVGHVAVLQGRHASPLVEPPTEVQPFIAKRGGEAGPDTFNPPRILRPGEAPAEAPAEVAPMPADPGSPGLVAARIPGGSESARFVGPPAPRADPPDPGRAVTLLVWVTRPRKS